MINQAAKDYFEWDDINNKRFNNGRRGGYEVKGVVEDFHYRSFHRKIEPLVILFGPVWPRQITVKISGNKIGETVSYIQKTWKKYFSENPLKYQFYDDWFDSMYKADERLGKIISFFAGLAISISCIGILGLAIFSSERRTKEIGIRKVNGAAFKNILYLLTRDFTLWVLIAFVIASPVDFFIIRKWLMTFAYRTEISWWTYMLSGISALLIAWGTVLWQTIKVALVNPVEVLRSE